jgi:hypothetical protein
VDILGPKYANNKFIINHWLTQVKKGQQIGQIPQLVKLIDYFILMETDKGIYKPSYIIPKIIGYEHENVKKIRSKKLTDLGIHTVQFKK